MLLFANRFNHDYITGCIGVPNGANNVTIENTLIVDDGSLCVGGDGGGQSSLVNNGKSSGPTGLSITDSTFETSQGGSGSSDWPLNVIPALSLSNGAKLVQTSLAFQATAITAVGSSTRRTLTRAPGLS